MPESPKYQAAREIALLLRRMVHFRRRLEEILPPNLLAARARLAETYLGGGKTSRSADFELLYRVGALLANRPEPVTMGELSRDLGVPLSTATRIVDWLVQGDYAQRLPDPDDRRVVRVGLSPTGQEAYQIAHGMICQQFEKWLDGFTPQECATLTSLLQRLLAAMEKE